MPHLYCAPLSPPRPFGSFRFDVYSRTAGRRLTLYGASSLNLFVDLELDWTVSHLCERPLVIPDSKPARYVEFWSLKGGTPFFYVTLRKGESLEAFSQRTAIQDFDSWVRGQHGQLIYVDFSKNERGKFRTSNLSFIAQHLSVFAPNRPAESSPKAFTRLSSVFTLRDAELIVDPTDPMRGRTQVFLAWIQGKLTCADINNLPLTAQTQFSKNNEH
ncbi:hypothetical protein [Tabrizicola sp.]|jgi:hypothetical protein|uniref:hypothetical protein n=1 Tax=Tabrizicola sp. TaxID=2005166 RepID=UPI0027344B63|nr:hypothetical protein [Tabrizicola sp.]MDP3194428.1 hypothetical protein [Tabrizicola sp.]